MIWSLAVLALAGVQAMPAPIPEDEVVVTGKPQKKVCERTTTLGSIIPVRVCKTPEQWEAMHEQALVYIQKMQEGQLQRQNAERHAQSQ